MNFFNLQILSCDEELLYQSDIEPMTFEGLATVLARELVRHNIFQQTERIVMRIVPRWDEQARQEKAAFVDPRQLSPLTNRPVDIVFDDALRSEPVSFFTLRWHSLDRFLVYQLDMGVNAVFDSLLKVAVANLIYKKKLSVTENFKFAVLARNEGLPTIDPELLSKVTIPAAVGVPATMAQAQPERSKKSSTISVTGRKSLVTQFLKDPSTYSMVEPVRQVTPGLLRVYMERSAWLRLREAVKVSEQQRVEVAGGLVGGVFKDEQGETFVEINDILPVPEAQGDFSSVRIDTEAWRGLMEKVNLHYSDHQKVVVGWYHTHLISKLSVTASMASTGELHATQQTFMSADDVFIHNHFFPEPWHVALVVDLNAHQDVFFCRHNRQLVDCGGFLLFGETDQR